MTNILDTEKGKDISDNRTICEVHRQLWAYILIALKNNPKALIEIKPIMEEAMLLGMKLIQYMIDHKIDEPKWVENNIVEAKQLREERIRIELELKKNNILL